MSHARQINHSAFSRRFFRAGRISHRHFRILAACGGFAAALAALSIIACKPRAASRPRPYVAFVANQQMNSVAAVDLGSLQMLASIPVGPSPTQVAARPGAKEIYVVSGTGSIAAIGFPELHVTRTLAVGRSAASLIFSKDGREAFVLDPADERLVFVDCDKNRVAGHLHLNGKPSSIALSQDGKLLMVGVMPSELIFVDAGGKKVLSEVQVGQGPGSMTIRSDGKQVFVAAAEQNAVSAVDISSRQLLAKLAVAAPITSLVLKPDGGEIFALSSPGSVAVLLDAYHDDVEQTLTTGQNPVAGAFTRDMSFFYIATAGDGNVTALDGQSRNVVSVVHAGTQPSALALTPDERFLAVTDAASASLAILRTDPLGLVTTIPVGSDPVHVVIPDWLWEGVR
jgi:DNA-binding beta-propeller fold protein YncE